MENTPIPKNDERINELVRKSQAGDSEAFGALYEQFITPIYRYIYYRVGAEETEDLTEMVFLKAWENIKQFRFGVHSFSSWIFRIAHNVIVDHYRLSRYNTEELPENVHDTRVEALASQRAHRSLNGRLISDALAELKDDYRQVVILKYINELSNEEIGVVMERSQASLRILQFRALRMLRKILEERGLTELDL
ncbi:sigma-70 family RNA polymerase sigma factor [Candidatus Gracilibacteria bacterium]|nr:sigma-70 family RNA polymerase sigma factor [Candidatus Gracilibacteria bacterium]